MESKGKYVWDPEKQAWVRPGEAAPPKPRVRPARPMKGPKKREPELAQDDVATTAKPVAARVEAEPAEVTYEEAVEGAGLEYASAVRRGIALFIDIIVASVIATIFPFIFGEGTWSSAIASHLVVLLYFVAMWVWRGQTLGKIVLGMKVVQADGTSIGLPRALLRGVILMFVYYIPMVYLGGFLIGVPVGNYVFPLIIIAAILLWISRSQTHRGPHDLIAGTMVVTAASLGEIEEVYEVEELEEEASE